MPKALPFGLLGHVADGADWPEEARPRAPRRSRHVRVCGAIVDVSTTSPTAEAAVFCRLGCGFWGPVARIGGRRGRGWGRAEPRKPAGPCRLPGLCFTFCKRLWFMKERLSPGESVQRRQSKGQRTCSDVTAPCVTMKTLFIPKVTVKYSKAVTYVGIGKAGTDLMRRFAWSPRRSLRRFDSAFRFLRWPAGLSPTDTDHREQNGSSHQCCEDESLRI